MKKITSLLNALFCFFCASCAVSGGIEGGASAETAADGGGKLPFYTLRMMSSSCEDLQYTKRLIDSIKNYPGTFDDVWLCTQSYYAKPEDMRRESENEIETLAKLWEDAGVEAAYQIDLTLGHGGASKNEYGFAPSDYRIAMDGKRLHSLCESSPKVAEFFFERVKHLASNRRIKSIWLDDDFRMGSRLDQTCFCPRCIGLFNKSQNADWTRESLAKALRADTAEAFALRKAWVDFHTEYLRKVADAARRGRDAGNPACRLALQSVHPLAYNCHDYPLILDAFAGKGGKSGIRIGSGYYSEFIYDGLQKKLFGIMFEADRCARRDNIFQICYEAENYPHISIKKTPRAMMIECAMMLAGGCDSLTLYWHSPDYAESQPDYERFAAAAAQWKPYLKRVAQANKNTRLYGIGRYIGSAKYKAKNNVESMPDAREYTLIKMGVPTISKEGFADFVLITPDTAAKLSDAELKEALSKKCVFDADTAVALQKRGFNLPAKITTVGTKMSLFGSAFDEIHRGNKFRVRGDARLLEITGKNCDEISPLRNLDGGRAASAFAVCDSGFGGRAFILGGDGFAPFSTEYRRAAMLDGLDKLAPMPVRLETSHALMFMPRVDKNGAFANATIFNMAMGETPELTLRVRSKTAEKYRLFSPDKPDIVLQSKKADDGDGYILTLPSLAPVSVYSVARL